MSEKTETTLAKTMTTDELLGALPALVHSDAQERAAKPQQVANNPTPWIGYKSNKSKARIDELKAAGVEDGQFYLYDMGISAPKPFFLHVITAFKCYTQQDDEGQITGVSATLNDALKLKGYAEHLFGVALVRNGAANEAAIMTAATFSQRKAMVRAFDQILGVCESFQKEPTGREYAGKSAAWKVAVSATRIPWARARAVVWGKLDVTNDGAKFNRGYSRVEPTPLADIEAIHRYLGLAAEHYKGECKKETALNAALRSHLRRVDELKEDMGAGARRDAQAKDGKGDPIPF